MGSGPESTVFRRRLLQWYSQHGRDLPWRRTEDPYAILVSEVMLQQTQVTTVVPFYEGWLKRFPNFEALAAASESDVLHAWQGLGYYSRARNLHSAAKLVVSQCNGVLPRDPGKIRMLPGMGRYTSNAVATFAFDQSVPIVEANISRVMARIFDIRVAIDSSAGRDRLWQTAESILPGRNAGRFNSALMDLGALICLKTPRCAICPVKSFCQARKPEQLPIKKARRQIERLTESHTITVNRNQILLEQCSDRWRGMWMLPRCKAVSPHRKRPVHVSEFPFTYHRVILRVFQRATDSARRCSEQWFSLNQLNSIPIPSPHRRAINACLSLSVGR